MKLPERRDFLDYADGANGLNGETQDQILKLLASSALLREQMAELKRDLYIVNAQIPEYQPGVDFAAELARLSQSWVKIVYARKFSFQQFYRSRELLFVMIFVSAGILAVLALIGIQLMR